MAEIEPLLKVITIVVASPSPTALTTELLSAQ